MAEDITTMLRKKTQRIAANYIKTYIGVTGDKIGIGIFNTDIVSGEAYSIIPSLPKEYVNTALPISILSIDDNDLIYEFAFTIVTADLLRLRNIYVDFVSESIDDLFIDGDSSIGQLVLIVPETLSDTIDIMDPFACTWVNVESFDEMSYIFPSLLWSQAVLQYNKLADECKLSRAKNIAENAINIAKHSFLKEA